MDGCGACDRARGAQDNPERWCCPRSPDHRVLVCIAAAGRRRILLNKTLHTVCSPLAPDAGAAGGEAGGGWRVDKEEVAGEAAYRASLRELFGIALDGPEYAAVPLFAAP
jgi:hypothetical protein